jgi:hypothetical protein
MLPDLKLVIRLQELDSRLGELEREVAALPRHIAEIQKKLISHERKLEADRAALVANQKDRKQREGEIQTQEQKISKLKDQMIEAKTNDQYRAFQNEIDFCQQEVRKFEDRILELMSESEPLERAVKAAEAALKAEKVDVEAEKLTARVRKERGAIVLEVTKPTYQRYEKTRKLRKGIAVAEALDGRCSACQMSMRQQFLQDLRKGEQVMVCESCLRILYYNPPVPVEDLAGDATPAAQR